MIMQSKLQELTDKLYNEVCFSETIDKIKVGVVYVIPSVFGFVNEARLRKNLTSDCMRELLVNGSLSHFYDVKVLDRSTLPKEFEEYKKDFRCTVIIPISVPDQDGVHFFVSYCFSHFVRITIRKMLLAAEMRQNVSLKNALINLAYYDPEYFEDLFLLDQYKLSPQSILGSSIASSEPRHLPNLSALQYSRRCYRDPTSQSRHERASHTLTLKEKNELVKRFISDVKKYKKSGDPNALRNIEIVLDFSVGVNDQAWKAVFLDAELEIYVKKAIFKKCIDRESQAKKSRFKVVVKRITNENDVAKNVGYYNVYLVDTAAKTKSEKLIKFTHQATAVVYIMYLIDRKNRKDDVDCLDLRHNKKSFVELYHLVYGLSDSDIERKYNVLIYGEPDLQCNSYSKGGRLKDCFSDITDTFSVPLLSGENPLPFWVNAKSHVMVLPENIEVDKELTDCKFS